MIFAHRLGLGSCVGSIDWSRESYDLCHTEAQDTKLVPTKARPLPQLTSISPWVAAGRQLELWEHFGVFVHALFRRRWRRKARLACFAAVVLRGLAPLLFAAHVSPFREMWAGSTSARRSWRHVRAQSLAALQADYHAGVVQRCGADARGMVVACGRPGAAFAHIVPVSWASL